MSIGYQSPTHSETLNNLFDEKFEQIKTISDEIKSIEESLSSIKVINNVNLEFIKRDFNSLEKKNKEYQQQILNLNSFNKKMNIFPTDLEIYSSHCYIDAKYNLASFLPSKTIPISHIDTSIGKYVPEDLNIEINDGFERYMYIETDPKNMIIGNINNPWYREYHIPDSSDINKITVTITINMPYNAINSYMFNNIIMTAFPFNNLNIDLIEIYSGDMWKRLEGNIINAKHIYIQSDLQNIEKLRLTVTQNKYLLINSEKIFYIGFSDLQVSHIKTEADKVCFSYDYAPSENVIINSVEAEIDKQFIHNDKEYFEYELFQLDVTTGYTTPISKYNHIYIDSGNTVRFLFYLYKHEIIPILRKIVINFSRNL